jgi:hypothetical protein
MDVGPGKCVDNGKNNEEQDNQATKQGKII